MFSGEGEEVPFKQVMYPRGNVEDWLLEVERVMMESLRQLMDEGLKDYLVVSIWVAYEFQIDKLMLIIFILEYG